MTVQIIKRRRNKMKVLVACEESQEVCKAFRERGHEAKKQNISRNCKSYGGTMGKS